MGNQMPSKPTLVTVATSRRDRYLPDSQAATIHATVGMILSNRLELATPTRLDRPTFSVCGKGISEDPVEGAKYLKDRFNCRYVTDILAPESAELHAPME